MELSTTIKSKDELEFVIFCIENIASRHGLNASTVYTAINNDSINLINKYIVPGYEFLHTQDKDYILDDIEEVMEQQGITIRNQEVLDRYLYYEGSERL